MLAAIFDGVCLLVGLGEALVHTGFGLRWIFSPRFRVEVRAKDSDEAWWYGFAAIFGLFILLGILTFAGYFLAMHSSVLLDSLLQRPATRS